jgi:hypothetical protein
LFSRILALRFFPASRYVTTPRPLRTAPRPARSVLLSISHPAGLRPRARPRSPLQRDEKCRKTILFAVSCRLGGQTALTGSCLAFSTTLAQLDGTLAVPRKGGKSLVNPPRLLALNARLFRSRGLGCRDKRSPRKGCWTCVSACLPRAESSGAGRGRGAGVGGLVVSSRRARGVVQVGHKNTSDYCREDLGNASRRASQHIVS